MATREVLKQAQTHPRSSAAAVLVTACCCVFVSFASLVIYTFGVFMKPLAETFHWSRGQLSLAFTVAALTVAVCSPAIGHLLDRYGARRVILPCTAIYGVTFASLALLTPHLWHLYLAFAILGVVGNGTTQLGYARVVSLWFDGRRGQALAAVMAGSGLGSMVFPPVAQALISTVGWRAGYAVLGTSVLILAIPLATLFLFEPEDRQMPHVSVVRKQTHKGVWSAPFLGIAGALLLFSFATNGLNTHWAALLTDNGATPARAAAVLSVAGSAALLAKLGTGYLLDRFLAGRVAASLLSLCALGFVFLILPYTWPLAIAAAILIGIGMGAESDVVPFLLTRYFGLEQFGALYGYTWSVYAVAGAAGPLVMGAAFDRTGSYRTVLLASLGMVIAASVLFGLLPAYPRHKPDERSPS